MSLGFTRGFELPLTPYLRDLFHFQGLEYQLWSITCKPSKVPEVTQRLLQRLNDPAANNKEDGPGGEGADDPMQRLQMLTQGVIPFRPFLDPATLLQSSGSPLLSCEVRVKLPQPAIATQEQPHPPPSHAKAAPPATSSEGPKEVSFMVSCCLNGDVDPSALTAWAPPPSPLSSTSTLPIKRCSSKAAGSGDLRTTPAAPTDCRSPTPVAGVPA